MKGVLIVVGLVLACTGWCGGRYAYLRSFEVDGRPVALAENAGGKGDWKTAVSYATVVTSLFDDPASVAAAKKIIESHPAAQEDK